MGKRIIEIQYGAKSVNMFWSNYEHMMFDNRMRYTHLIEIKNCFGKALIIPETREKIVIFGEENVNVVAAMMHGYDTTAREVAPVLCV